MKKETSHLLGFRARHQYSNQRSSQKKALRVASTAADPDGGGKPNDWDVIMKKAADG